MTTSMVAFVIAARCFVRAMRASRCSVTGRQPLSTRELFAFAGLVAQQVFVYIVVPASPFANIVEPVYLATLASTALTVGLIASRLAPRRYVKLERQLLAAFLAGMPVIYAVTAIQHGASGAVVSMEATAILVFGVLAIVGAIGSPWFLVVGIGGHGLFWDAWHHPTQLVVPGWYAVGCFVVDIALAAYVATQVPVYAKREGSGTVGPSLDFRATDRR